MKAVTIRIGNDIPLVWRFFTRNGEEKIPYPIEGKDTKIEDTVAIMVTPLDNAVRYDTAQELTDEQKRQARENIGITEEIMNLIYAIMR